jgi:hypothetical protein
MTAAPGRSHVRAVLCDLVAIDLLELTVIQHGTPLEKIEMGTTAIDEETFDDYIAEMRNHYTADKVSVKAADPQQRLLTKFPSITS